MKRGRKGEGGREGGISHPLIYFLKVHSLGPVKAQNLELNPGLPYGQQSPKYLSITFHGNFAFRRLLMLIWLFKVIEQPYFYSQIYKLAHCIYHPLSTE